MLNLLALVAKIPVAVLVFGIIVIIMSIFLIIAVLMQQGKQHNLSGTIAGAADTFFGKTKGQAINNKLSILTSVVAIVFVIFVLVFNFVNTENENIFGTKTAETTAAVEEDTTTAAPDTTADAADDTANATDDTADAADETAGEADTTEAAEVGVAEDEIVDDGEADIDEADLDETKDTADTQN